MGLLRICYRIRRGWMILQPFFEHGFALDGLEEPLVDPEEGKAGTLSYVYSQLPGVLVARMRRTIWGELDQARSRASSRPRMRAAATTFPLRSYRSIASSNATRASSPRPAASRTSPFASSPSPCQLR